MSGQRGPADNSPGPRIFAPCFLEWHTRHSRLGERTYQHYPKSNLQKWAFRRIRKYRYEYDITFVSTGSKYGRIPAICIRYVIKSEALLIQNYSHNQYRYCGSTRFWPDLDQTFQIALLILFKHFKPIFSKKLLFIITICIGTTPEVFTTSTGTGNRYSCLHQNTVFAGIISPPVPSVRIRPTKLIAERIYSNHQNLTPHGIIKYCDPFRIPIPMR
jgi:hypothetical protein